MHAQLIRSMSAMALTACISGLSTPALAQQRRPGSAPPEVPAEGTEPPGAIAEPAPVTRAALFADRILGGDDRKNGWYFDFGNMIPGAGWISGGPGYRRWFAQDRAVVDGSAAVSWRGYKTAQARIEMPALMRSRIAVGSQVLWQDFTQVTTYGSGAASLERNISEYRLRSRDLVGYATFRPMRSLAVDASVGWLKPSVLPRGGAFMRDRPDTRALFPGDAVFARVDQPAFVHTEAAVEADTRDFPGHPTDGGLWRAVAAQYSDRDGGLFTFRRYEAEGMRFLPLAGARAVVALHGWLVATDTDAGATVPFYLQPSLGGHNSLRSFADYRFHDRNLLAINAELRFALMTHVDAAGFFDAGNVAARVGDLNLDKRSVGAGLRFHTRRQTFARFDLARGSEGWSAVFRLTDPLKLPRIDRRTASVPFVP